MEDAEEERERGCGAEEADESMEDEGSCWCELATGCCGTSEASGVGAACEAEGKRLSSGLEREAGLCGHRDGFSWSRRAAIAKQGTVVLGHHVVGSIASVRQLNLPTCREISSIDVSSIADFEIQCNR